MIKYSVVIPTYNRASELKRCLESLTEQTYKNFEVLVADDGSTDSTKDVIDLFKSSLDIKYFYQENWGGPARGRNVCIDQAVGEWVCFLDSDDRWRKNKLAFIDPYTSDYDLIHHELQFFNKTGFLNKSTNGRQLKNTIFKDLLVAGNCIATSGTSVKTSFLLEVGKFEESRNLISAEDYDLWIRISKKTEKFKYLPETLGDYWVGDDNISAASTYFLDCLRRVINRYSDDLLDKEKEQARLTLSYIDWRNYQQMGREKVGREFLKIAMQSNIFWVKKHALFFSMQSLFKGKF